MRSLTVAALYCAMLVLSGCTSTTKTGINTGIRVDLFLEHDNALALYRANRDGTIEFAGGAQARHGTIEWMDEMTAEEIESLRTLLLSPFWSERRRDSGSPSKGEQRFEINVDATGVRNRLVIRARPEDVPEEVVQLHDLLRNAAARRFDPVLRELPKAGPLRRTDR